MGQSIDGFRLSHQQRRLWLAGGDGCSSRCRCGILLDGPLDEDALERALAETVARHGILRTTFHLLPEMDLPLQVIGDGREMIWRKSALEAAEREDWKEEFGRFLHSQPSGGLELNKAPVLEADLLRLEDRRHVLLLTLPALAADARSFVNLALEIAHRYGEASEEQDDEALQYVQVSEWQYGLFEDEEEAAAGKSYWERLAAGDGTDLFLSFQRTEPAPDEAESAEWPVEIEPDLVGRIEKLANSLDSGADTFLLACWLIVLARMTGRSTLTAGRLVDGRQYEEIEEAVGPLERIVPIQIEILPGSSFEEIMKRVRDQALEGDEHQQYFVPGPGERSDAGDPLTVYFSFETWPPRRRSGELRFEILLLDIHGEPFRLNLHGSSRTEGLELKIRYLPKLFRAEDVDCIARCFSAVAADAVSRPRSRVGDLTMLAAGESEQLIRELNPEPLEAVETCAHELFESWAAEAPERPAVVFEDRYLSARELDVRSNRLASHLRNLGAEPETVVVVAVDRCLEMIIALMGVLKSGAAYVPLDLAQPGPRLEMMLDESGSSILVTTTRPGGLPVPREMSLICLDGGGSGDFGGGVERPDSGVKPENLVYVVFTSGSTGRPKGVAVQHRQLVHYVRGLGRRLGLSEGAHFATGSALAADLGNTSIFSALCGGGCLHILSQRRVTDPDAMAEYFEGRSVDGLKIVPSHLKALSAGSEEARIRPRRWLVLGGEASSMDWVASLGKKVGCEIYNHYGPTETTVGVMTWKLTEATGDSPVATMPIGSPLPGSRVYLLDAGLRPVPYWVSGEIYIGGGGLARGYLNAPGLTAEKFLPDPLGPSDARMYRTGDLARLLPDGWVEFLGRSDDQVKLRGFRIELGEIGAALEKHPAVSRSVVVSREADGENRLVAYVVLREEAPSQEELRGFLRGRLPEYMIPTFIVVLEYLPLLPNGKIDRRALPDPGLVKSRVEYLAPETRIEKNVAAIWQDVLKVERVGLNDNFFDLGGHSLLLARVHARLKASGHEVSMVDLFNYPTVDTLSRYLGRQGGDSAHVVEAPAAEPGLPRSPADALRAEQHVASTDGEQPASTSDIAVVGMCGRFPGADSIEELWRNLRDGVESIRFYTEEELAAAGVDRSALENPRYVRAASYLEGGDRFDAAFFGYSPREAEIIDPQQRIFLECAYSALEDSGYDPFRYSRRIGVFAGASVNTYLINLFSNPQVLAAVGPMQLRLGNRNDFLPTRVSYKLDLKGPSLNVQCGCSTSLASVCLACDSLVKGQSDMALAGGVTFAAHHKLGYLSQEGGVASVDGHTRTFDAGSSGTTFGDGVGVVVLKRLKDAVADGDAIRAIIKGWAANNDGSSKVGFTAPSIEGQSRVIADALAHAGTHPERIGYVEAHGTATRLGDPIEVAALTRAFRLSTKRNAYCAIGSVKTNFGHLDAASGVVGLIKTVLALENRKLPPNLHFESPNREIRFEETPFYVNTDLADWSANGMPRQAGVSSFGVGGTNVHVVLEEAPDREASPAPAWPEQLLLLSGRSPEVVETMTANLRRYLEEHPDTPLADVAFTLQVGRSELLHRRMLVCRNRQEALAILESRDPELLRSAQAESPRPVVFLFAGQGARRGLASEIFRSAPGRRWLKELLDLASSRAGFDLASMETDGDRPLTALQTEVTLFTVGYVLGRLWMSWGVRAAAMIGAGVGELVAASLAGVLTWKEGLDLAAARGRYRAEPSDAAVEDFLATARAAEPKEPELPYVSIVSGNPVSAETCTDPGYWLGHLEAGLGSCPPATLPAGAVLLEIGCDEALRRHVQKQEATEAVSCLPLPTDTASESRSVLHALGRLWLTGARIDWGSFYQDERRRRVALPLYPFDRQRYWVDSPNATVERELSRALADLEGPEAQETAAGPGDRTDDLWDKLLDSGDKVGESGRPSRAAPGRSIKSASAFDRQHRARRERPKRV